MKEKGPQRDVLNAYAPLLGKKCRDSRIADNVSVSEMSEYTHCSQRYIKRFEAGKEKLFRNLFTGYRKRCPSLDVFELVTLGYEIDSDANTCVALKEIRDELSSLNKKMARKSEEKGPNLEAKYAAAKIM